MADVRLVAVQAFAFLGGGVGVTRLHPVRQVVVAGEAETMRLVGQELFEASGVRQVAGRALAAREGSVPAHRALELDLLVAARADLAKRGVQETLVLAGVRVVAAGAVPFLEGRVDDILPGRGEEGLVAISAELPGLVPQ